MTAKTTLQDVSNVIENLVAQKTLSLDGMEGIQKLKERAETADKEIERLRIQTTSLETRNDALSEQLSQANEQLRTIADREKAVAKREDDMHKLEMAAAVAQAEARTIRHALGVVFAPNTVREAVQKHGMVAGQNGMSYPTSDGGMTQRTEGYQHPDDPKNMMTPPGERSNLG